MSDSPPSDTFSKLRGGESRRPVTAAVVAAQTNNPRCGLLSLANAAGVSLDKVFKDGPFRMPFGQARSALARGEQFERRVKEDRYRALLELLREALNAPAPSRPPANLRAQFPHDPRAAYAQLERRAQETRRLVELFVRRDPSAPLLIDGAVLTVKLGGQLGYLEADALALGFDTQLRVGEIKSFPVVEGRADPDKVGSAADQSAVYVMALEDLVASIGGSPGDLVSREILLITPLNVGMKPTVSKVDVSRRVERHRRELTTAEEAAKGGLTLPQELEFPGPNASAEEAAAALERVAGCTGTHYGPGCLGYCGLSRWCRDRARRERNPVHLGTGVLRLLPGVGSTSRVLELASGDTPSAEEAAAAEPLVLAANLLKLFGPSAGRSDAQSRRRRATG